METLTICIINNAENIENYSFTSLLSILET